jgi:hypothetical protein
MAGTPGHDRQMPTRKNAKALLTGEASVTIGFGGLALACEALMLVGGPFVVIGLVLAIICCAVIVSLYWREMWTALRAGRFSRHSILPLAVVVLIPALGVLLAFKEPILAIGKAPPLPPQRVPAADLEITKIETDVPRRDGYINAQFYLKNKGVASAIQFKHSELVHEFPREMTPLELDQVFGQMAVALSSISPPTPSSEIKPGAQEWYSFVGREAPSRHLAPGRAAFMRQKAGKSRIYVITRNEYRYPLLPEGAWAFGERCSFWFQSVVHVCPTHNGDMIPQAAFSPPAAAK